MVLRIAEVVVSAVLPRGYWIHAVLLVAALAAIRAFAQGRTTTRERDLHARVILVTGAFTPFGLTLVQSLAQRGAHIIALSPLPVDSPQTEVLVELIRATTENEHVYAEQCDLASAQSVHDFCDRFLTGQQDPRLDALLFTHEYPHVGHRDDKARWVGSLATFMIITRLLPALLVAPVERDIRIINVVNPFYAAPARSFDPSREQKTPQSTSTFLQEGQRSLRMVVLTRHLQRVLDALPSKPAPRTQDGTSAVPVVSEKLQRSNIVAVSVSPGISRSDTVAPLLKASSVFGVILYTLLQPLLRLLTKSSTSAIQTVLHALFLPTPFKIQFDEPSSTKDDSTSSNVDKSSSSSSQEVLKPGALYSDCAAVQLQVTLAESIAKEHATKAKDNGNGGKEAGAMVDDGELGGELAGRLVWESLEVELKKWEKEISAEDKPEEKSAGAGENVSSAAPKTTSNAS